MDVLRHASRNTDLNRDLNRDPACRLDSSRTKHEDENIRGTDRGEVEGMSRRDQSSPRTIFMARLPTKVLISEMREEATALGSKVEITRYL